MMTFDEWFETQKDDFEYNVGIAHHAWNVALDQCVILVENMDGCTDVDYCRQDVLAEIEKLRCRNR